MKQFIFAKSIAADDTKLNALDNGAIGFAPKGLDKIGGELKDEFNLVVKEGDYLNIQPIHSNKFKYVKSTKINASAYVCEVTIPTSNLLKGSYSIIIVKNGVGFNERNKWTVTYHSKEVPTATNVANDLVAQINKLGFVTASFASSKLTITAKEKGVAYTVLVTDNLTGAAIKETKAVVAQNDAKVIKDLYDKCVADRGINYTYEDNAGLYPNLSFNPLKGSDSVDKGFTVFTLTFAEPRNTKTTDEVVNQVVHVIFPSDVTITVFEDKLKAIAGGSVETTAMESPAV